MVRNRKGHPTGQGLKSMTIAARIFTIALSVREFLVPTYRPERYYMRGPGPACARARGSCR